MSAKIKSIYSSCFRANLYLPEFLSPLELLCTDQDYINVLHTSVNLFTVYFLTLLYTLFISLMFYYIICKVLWVLRGAALLCSQLTFSSGGEVPSIAWTITLQLHSFFSDLSFNTQKPLESMTILIAMIRPVCLAHAEQR